MDDQSSPNTLNIYIIGAALLAQLAKKPKYIIFAVTIADIKKALALKKRINPAIKVLVKHHKYFNTFLWKEADKLVEYRLYNHKIIFKEGKQLKFGPLYRMSQNKLQVLREYLNEMLNKEFIRVSSSPIAAPVIFIKKFSSSLRFYVDY